MTLMLTTEFIESLPVLIEPAYISAISNGVLVGSVGVYGVDQVTISIWGDDSSTSEIDGAFANTSFELQLVNDNIIYSLDVGDLTFVINDFNPIYA